MIYVIKMNFVTSVLKKTHEGQYGVVTPTRKDWFTTLNVVVPKYYTIEFSKWRSKNILFVLFSELSLRPTRSDFCLSKKNK